MRDKVTKANVLIVFSLCVSIAVLCVVSATSKPDFHAVRLRRISEHSSLGAANTTKYPKMPLMFEENGGRTDDRVKFLVHEGLATVLLTSKEAVFLPPGAIERSSRTASAHHQDRFSKLDSLEVESDGALRIELVGSNAAAVGKGSDPGPSHVNYFIGNDPSKWMTNIPAYTRVRFSKVYPGIDLAYYGNGHELEHDFVVAPGARADRIHLRVVGADKMRLDAGGTLQLEIGKDTVSMQKPIIYQESEHGRDAVPGGYVLTAKNEIAFQISSYDPSRPLIIDPVLVLSTYFAGGFGDYPACVTADASGNIYVAGGTPSTSFPLKNPLESTPPTSRGIGFISKFDPTGTTLIYSTYFGGTQGDGVKSIQVDSQGDAFVSGVTDSADFPTTPGAYSTSYVAGQCNGVACFEAFIAKINPTGSSLLYSTLLGSVGDTFIEDNGSLAIDSTGDAFVTGNTSSTTFPTTAGAFQPSCILTPVQEIIPPTQFQ